MKLTVQNGKVSIETPSGLAKWSPRGEPVLYGENPAKKDVYGVPSHSSRMFIGFNVGKKPTHNVDKLADLYRRVRETQKNDKGEPIPPEASFVIQKGLYVSPVDGLIYEDSVQLIVLSLYGESEERFTDNMVEIAGVVARDFKQEVVILEIQKKGVPQEVYGISWQS